MAELDLSDEALRVPGCGGLHAQAQGADIADVLRQALDEDDDELPGLVSDEESGDGPPEASAASPHGNEADVADCLGRESQFFVGSCVFGPMINEARAILGMQSMTHLPGRIQNAPRLVC